MILVSPQPARSDPALPGTSGVTTVVADVHGPTPVAVRYQRDISRDSGRDVVQVSVPAQLQESLLHVVAGVAAIAADRGLHSDALRLLTAVEINRRVSADHPDAPDIVVLRRIRDRSRATLTTDAADRAVVAGRRLSLMALTRDTEALLDSITRQLVEPPARSEIAGATEVDGLSARFGLTHREIEVLGLVAEGLPDREIGERLFISPRTAMRHVGNVLCKLEVSSRTAAAATYLRDRAT